MTPARIRWLALAVALIVLAVGYLSLFRVATILVEGQVYDVSTRAITVGGALKAAGLQLGPKDEVEPAAFMPLRNGMVIALHRASQIQLLADGEIHRSVSAQRDPAALLAEFDLQLGAGDRLLLAGHSLSADEQIAYSPFLALELRRSHTITLQEDGQSKQIVSSAPTLGEALAESGVQIDVADRLEPAADTPLNADMSANLTHAQAVQIAIGDETVELHVTGDTVGQALAEAGIVLQGLDYSRPAEGELIPADRGIRIFRVTESVLLEQESIPHEVEYQEDPEAELDTMSIVQLGQDGVQAARVRIRYENGAEISRAEEAERVLVQPVTQINGYGSQIVIRTVVVDGVTIEYYRAVEVFTTWYSPCNSGVSTCLYGTASGLPVQKGTIATYLNWYRALKFATVYVPGYGPGTIGDTGAYPDGRPWVDLAYGENDAHNWVNTYVTMYFTTPVPAYVPLVWPP
jgi:uncharacterized protein YabE (DUF348 family)/3D (Asp-Asp-Asp) domain-containing protein